MKNQISSAIRENILIHNDIEARLSDEIIGISQFIAKSILKGKKVLICGNGGSAADAQHFAGEFVVRLKSANNRRALPAIALTVDSSVLTACANDFGYRYIFSRQVEALGNEGDILIAISTSGTSPNVVEAMKTAGQKHMEIIGLTGYRKQEFADMCRFCIDIQSDSTLRIQEGHIFVIHTICELVEKEIFGF